MAKTYQDVVTEARVLLQDTDTVDPRYTDTVLIALYNRGLQVVARKRPDAFYDLYSNNSLNVPELSDSPSGGQTDWTDTFGLELQFFNPLVNFIVGMAEIVDDEYTEDGRAALLLQAFERELMGV